MQLDQFINLLALLIGTGGSVFVLKSDLLQKPNVSAEQGSTKYGFNTTKYEAIARKTSESRIGVYWILLALTIALVNSVWLPSNISAFNNKALALFVGLFILIVVYYLFSKIENRIYHAHLRDIGKIKARETLDHAVIKKIISNSNINTLREIDHKLTMFRLPDEMAAQDFVHAFAKEIGYIIPNDASIEQ